MHKFFLAGAAVGLLALATPASAMPMGKMAPGLANAESGVLDDDGTNAVALDAIKQGREAGACLDGISAGYGGVGELANQGEPCPLGETLDGRSLPLVRSKSAR